MKKWLMLTGFVVAGAIGAVSIAQAAVRCTYEEVEYACSCGGPTCKSFEIICESY